MNSKIYRAKLVTIHNQIQEDRNQTCSRKESIHAYFGMLHHFVHRNKHRVKELKVAGKKLDHSTSLGKPFSVRQRSSERITTISHHNNYHSKDLQKRTKRQFLKRKQRDLQIKCLQRLKKTLDQPYSFIPIGQASRNSDYPQIVAKKSRIKTEISEKSQRFLETQLIDGNSAEKVFKITKPHLNIRKSRSISKVRAQAADQTYYSSLNTSQRSKSSKKSSLLTHRKPNESQQVTPW